MLDKECFLGWKYPLLLRQRLHMHSGSALIMAVKRKWKNCGAPPLTSHCQSIPLFTQISAYDSMSQLKHVIWNGITPCSRSTPAKLNHSVSSANPRLKRAIYSPAETRPGAGVKLQILFIAFSEVRGDLCAVVWQNFGSPAFMALLFKCFSGEISLCWWFLALFPILLLSVPPWICRLFQVFLWSGVFTRVSPHLEKKQRWPAEELSPSYESLCLRLSGGLLWLCPSLGAETSMLLLLSLLLELRPGLESPRRPELSWEEGRDEPQQLSFFAHSTKITISSSRAGLKLYFYRQNSDLCGGVQMWFFRTKADRKSCSIMFDEISKSGK